ncbi:4-hydroxybenzoate octaprenyltransferase [Rhodobacteraceae bacterium KN286]|uniref:4-hydroxybenzoate octaprenyltransferase n=2 Tax=Oceanomicrobium pacificus TaxID=2692916 RepID=A0A6B0TQ36_9RHOB|nr:4-hydroxybenzoate octaprenyltransferase [Oceanomicrobium pacificus]
MPDSQPDGRADGQVADAPPDNWVDRWCPAWSRPYLRLSRADRPIGTWLLLLPCWWGLGLALMANPGSAGWSDLWVALACVPGAFLMRGAGCTWNDYTDRHIDGAVERTRSRPLPSGQVSPKAALVWMAAQALLAFMILLTFNPFTIALGIAALGPVAIYPFAKRFTWWPQVFLGIAFNWGILVGWAAHAGSLSWAPLTLYLSAIAWTLFYDTIYAHQDREDDALIGVKSTARLFADNTPRWLFLFLVVSVTLMGVAVLGVTIPDGRVVPALVGLAAAWGFGWHLAWQLSGLRINDPATCLRLFRTNRTAGLIPALLFIGAGLL